MSFLTTRPCLSPNLGDARLDKRFNLILDQLCQTYSQSIPQAMQNKAQTKGAYRFFRHAKVNSDKLIQAHAQSICLDDEQAYNDLYLCLSDSTELDYTGKKSESHLGPLTYKKRRGMIAHQSLLVNASGGIQGILNQCFIIRKDTDFGQSKERKTLPIEQKESYRWLKDFEQMQKLSQEQQRQIVFVADREADMMEIFHARRYEQAHFLIRSQFNRCMKDKQEKLYEFLATQQLRHTYETEVIHPKTRKARKATLQVRFASVNLELSGYTTTKSKKHLKPVHLQAVEVKEVDPPLDLDEPIHWVLLTSLNVENAQQAMQVINYYLLRWIIERFHFLLKSGGANIEQLQMEQPQTLKNAITTYSITLMNAMKIKYLAENQPDISITETDIDPDQCQIIYQYVQQYVKKDIQFDLHKPPNTWEFCRVLGMLGGFIPSKRQPLPGLKILTRALDKLKIITDAQNMIIANLSKN